MAADNIPTENKFVRVLHGLLAPLKWVLTALFGQINWKVPGWLGWLSDKTLQVHARADANQTRAQTIGIALAVLVAAAGGGKWWYDHLPKPREISLKVTDPILTRYPEDAKPFVAPLRISFSEPAAPIEKAGKDVTTGIDITPKLEGQWHWDNDRQLSFQPKDDWAVGAQYNVTVAKEKFILANTRLKDYTFSFKTEPFTASVNSGEFYIDPTDAKQKKVVINTSFSHPVDAQDFEKHVLLQMQGQKNGVLGIGKESTKFSVTYDKLKLNAYIHSAPIPVPDQDTNMKFTLSPGVRAARGGEATAKEFEKLVIVPGSVSLRVASANIVLVNNDKFEPEQVLALEISNDVAETDFRAAVSAVLLPTHPANASEEVRKKSYSWSDTGAVDNATLKAAKPLTLAPIAGEREITASHSFKFQATPGRELYVKIKKGLKSQGGYQLADDNTFIIKIPKYPKELRIMADGSLLALKGERKISIYSRDIPALRFEVSRVLPQQLQNFVTQTGGDFSHPEFVNSGFDASNVAERYNEVRELPPADAGKAQYQGFDLGKYIEGSDNKYGLFLVKVEAYDVANKRTAGQQDQRFVLLTDLGVLAKKATDGSQDVFVQSIENGDPVNGATVDILGRNGITLLTQTTDADGHVKFPDLKNFKREQQPVLYAVRKGGDLSFLPMTRNDRRLDNSRYDIGGMTNAIQADKLSAYLFSDRGIYRPGDKVNIGMIIKAADWKQKLAGMPLETVITDARGLTVKKETIKLSAQGFEDLQYATLETSPTGTYNANLYIIKDGKPDAQIGGTTFKVQEFLPDRMKMSATLSATTDEGWISPKDLKAKIKLMNLFGTPAANRRVTGNLSLTPAYAAFPSHKDYHFYDPQRKKESQEEALAESKTDDAGETSFDFNLERFGNSSYQLNFLTEGFELEGGRSVKAEAGVMVSSMPYLVGYKSDGDTSYIPQNAKRSVDVIAVNAKAKKIAVDKLTVSQIEHRYISVLTKQNSGLYKYQSVRKEIALGDKTLSISADGVSVTLPTAKPGDFALIIHDADGLELNRIGYNVSGTGNLTRSLEKNAELQISLNKKDFAPDEEIEMQIRAPYAGAGLITIERERVHSYRWFKATETNSVQKIKLPAGFEGNGYVTVTFIRDLNSDAIFMSPLSHGVAPFSVSIDRRKEKLSVATADLARPGEPFKMQVKSDKPSRVVVFAVDEGILQVAGYKGADPISYFFQKRALEVNTTQILDLILPEFKRLMAAAAPGGDAAGAIGKHLNPFKRKRDKPVAFWSGIVDAGPSEKEIAFDVPDYFNGTLRVMAVAVTDDTIGTFQKKAQVRGDFVINPNVPTTVSPGDEFDISVAVSNNVIGSGKDAAVAFSLATSKHFEIVGTPKLTLKIGEMREGAATYRLRAKEVLGSGSLNFLAGLGAKSGKFATDISVRPAQPFVTSVAVKTVRNGSTTTDVDRDLYPEYRKVEGGMSVLPLAMAQGLASYLAEFPYGCTEQLVSQGMPAVILKSRPEFGYAPAHAEKAIQSIISQLRARQQGDGGFSLWGGDGHTHDFATVYAIHFLMEARDRGIVVPPDMLISASKYLQVVAAKDRGAIDDERLHAYAVYLLTRSGVVTTNYVAALQKRLEEKHGKVWKNDLAAVYLAASYQLMKQERLAESTISGYQLGFEPNRRYYNYYDPLIGDAKYIYILAKHFPQRAQKLGGDALDYLVKPLQKGSYNTLSSAYTIMAIDAYAQVATLNDNVKFAMREIAKDGQAKDLTLSTGLFQRAAISPGAAKVAFDSGGDFTTYTVLTQAGFDRGLPTKAVTNGLEVLREYTDLKGKPINSVKVGDEIEVHVKMRSLDESYVPNLAIVDLLPGGFEIVMESRPKTESAPSQAGTRHRPNAVAPKEETDDEDARDAATHRQRNPQNENEGEGEGEGNQEGEAGNDGAQGEQGWTPPFGSVRSSFQLEYADVREDRIVLYGTANKSLGEFVYRIKATNAGTFNAPPTYGESMYDRRITARSTGTRLTVEKQ